MISDQSARQKIVSELDSSFAVDAGAGTGKTTLLIDRLAAFIAGKGHTSGPHRGHYFYG